MLPMDFSIAKSLQRVREAPTGAVSRQHTERLPPRGGAQEPRTTPDKLLRVQYAPLYTINRIHMVATSLQCYAPSTTFPIVNCKHYQVVM